MIGWLTGMRNRYLNCRYWYASRRHALFNAVFRPSHADKNLKPPQDPGQSRLGWPR